MKQFKYAVGVLLFSALVVVLSWAIAQNQNRSGSDLSVDLLNSELSGGTIVLQEGNKVVFDLENSSSDSLMYNLNHTLPANWLSLSAVSGEIEANTQTQVVLTLNCVDDMNVVSKGGLVIEYEAVVNDALNGRTAYELELNCNSPELREEAEETATESDEETKLRVLQPVNPSAKPLGIQVPALEQSSGFNVAMPAPVIGRTANQALGDATLYQPPPPFAPQPEDFPGLSNTTENNEVYATITENQFLDVLENPVSTFSVDVDTASYSNIRRMLRDGYLPPADAVRTEEFINYFSYDYADPEDGSHPFAIHTDFATAPWNTKHQLLRIGLQGKHIDVSQLPPSNLVFLIDVSGSMSDDIALVKTAFSILTDNMRSTDRVAIVVYAGAAGVVLDSTPGDRQSKIIDALNKLQAGGSTAGGAGIELAYSIAQENFISDGNNRIILATDGDFNVGASSEAQLERLITSKRDDGIFLSMLGFGQGNYHDSYMELLADKGNGNYAYIDSALEARKVLFEQFAGTLFTIAKDVKIQLEFNPLKVKSYRLIGYENRMLAREDFDNDKKDAGEIGAGHSVTALYEVIPVTEGETPTGENVYTTTIVSEAALANDLMTIRFRYKPPHLDESRLLEQRVAYELNDMSVDFNFASAVAEFTLLLRDSEFKANADFDQIIKRANASKGKDDEGYRAEFIQLVKQAQVLAHSSVYNSDDSEESD